MSSNWSTIDGYSAALSLWYLLLSYSVCNSACLASMSALEIGVVSLSQVIWLISSALTLTCAFGLILSIAFIIVT